jgi:exosortase/archaeosortase family protein
MVLLYAVLYHPYPPDSAAARVLVSYLSAVARVSAWVLRVFGEPIIVDDTTVQGRFSFIVVLDCGALDAQAFFAAAVLGFPARIRDRLFGLCLGLALLFAANIARLVALYFVALHSVALFHVMHEEVMVLAMIALVCAVFFIWARWARSRDLRHASLESYAA